MPDQTEHAEAGAKAQGDDEGKALEINDKTDRSEPEQESRSDGEYQGKALQINDNSKGADK